MAVFHSKLFGVTLILFVLGVTSGIIKYLFYGGIDENGILQESLFLPLSFLLIAFAFVFAAAAIIKRLFIR